MSSKKNRKSIVSLWRLTAALIFLFDPNIGLVELLPDFIGYLLLCSALTGVSFIDDRIAEALTLLRRMVLITLGRFLALFVTYGVVPYSDRSTMVLLLSFVFGIAELCTVIPAILKLSEGVLYLAERHGGEAVYYVPPRRKGGRERRNITQRLASTAITFAVIKALCGTLPELASLSGQGYDESHWDDFLGLFRTVGVAVSLTFGIIFLCCGIKYIMRLRTDGDHGARLWSVYDAVMAEHPDHLARRAVLSSFVYFGVGAALAVDFGLDGLSTAGGGVLGSVNIIPDALVALCFLLGLLTIRKHITNWKLPAAIAVIYLFVTCGYAVLQYYFAANYYIEAISIDPETNSFYMLVCAGAICCSVLFVALLVAFMRQTVNEIIQLHTGFSMTTHDTYDPREKLKELHHELTMRTVPVICVGVVAAVLEALSVCLVATVDFLWIFAFIVDIIYAVMFIRLLGEIRTQIDYKYMLS